jgi:glycosyltransferase involved in cell wall biosynthesis
LPGLEAMMHGAAVVSSNATCLPEVHGDAAVYFDPLNVNDMATKITSVIDNPTLRADLIKRGAKQAASFSWERMAGQTLEVFERALLD